MSESILLRQFASMGTMHTTHTVAKENVIQRRVPEAWHEHVECFFSSTYTLWALKGIIATCCAMP